MTAIALTTISAPDETPPPAAFGPSAMLVVELGDEPFWSKVKNIGASQSRLRLTTSARLCGRRRG